MPLQLRWTSDCPCDGHRQAGPARMADVNHDALDPARELHHMVPEADGTDGEETRGLRHWRG